MNRMAMLTIPLLLVFTASQVSAQGAEKKAAKETEKELKDPKKAIDVYKRGPVSEKSKAQFLIDFGRIPDALWSTTDYYDKVFFTDKNGQKMTAFYGRDGKLVATSFIKAFTDLPSIAQRKIKKVYKDYAITSVYFIDYRAEKGGVRYYGRRLLTDNYFVVIASKTMEILLRVNTNGTVFFFKQL
jgi:hypothetical protein